MRTQGHLCRRLVSMLFSLVLITQICSCASLNAPWVFRAKSLLTENSTDNSASSTHAIENLTPHEGTTIYKRGKTPISVTIKLGNDGEYLLQLNADKKKFKQLRYVVAAGGGEVDFDANIRWYIRPKGKTENISVALYRIDRSTLGKTEIITLLKQIRRKYNVEPKQKSNPNKKRNASNCRKL